MATHKSAEKRARQSVKRAKRNSMVMSSVRTVEKKLRSSIAAADKTLAAQLLKEFSSYADGAVSKGVLHYKTAARKISRLATRVNSLTK